MESNIIAEQVGRTGLAVFPNFFTVPELDLIRSDFTQIQSENGFHRAGTGQAHDLMVRNLIRGDKIHWIERDFSTVGQLLLWNKIDLLKQAFNRTLFLGLSEFEGHYSCYVSGGFYRRHLDCFQRDQARKITIVLYLNKNWCALDGGILRVYDSHSFTDIEPQGGTLVCFLSGESEHEVMLSHAERISFTGWFKCS